MTRLRVERLAVRGPGGAMLLAPLDFALEGGRCLCFIGESGAGKSLVCAAVAGTLPPELLAAGRVWLDETEVTALPAAARRHLWSRALFLLPQEPGTALAPARTTLVQVGDMPRRQGEPAGAAARLLRRVGLDPTGDGGKRPGALSGGMAQRAAMATVMGSAAPLILVDEPTKGLDPARQAMAEAGLRALLEEGRSVLLVTHDLRLAARLGDDVVVMREGRVVESGPAAGVLEAPRHSFTQALLAAEPRRWARRASTAGVPAATARNLTVRPAPGAPDAATGLDFTLAHGGITGLCGPSGCGKTTLGDTVLGLRRPAAGEMRRSPGITVQKLYQDPGAAFAPWRSVRATMADVLHPRRAVPDARCRAILQRLGLSPALLDRRPGAVSGGELQRLSLARALLADSTLLFADEPTSRLDAIAQRGFMELLGEAAADGRAILLASHDPDLVACMADQVVTLGAPAGQDASPARPSSVPGEDAVQAGSVPSRITSPLI